MRVRMGQDETPGIAMEPMIDCVFLMLIFFLIAATIRKKHNELPIDLAPAGNDIEVKGEDEMIVISVLPDNKLVYSTVGAQYTEGKGANEPVTMQKLMDKLDNALSLTPSARVRIDADRDARLGKLVEVLDALKVRNFTNIGIRTADKKR